MTDTIVLAGGGASRLGGTDKVLLTVAGTSLLDLAVAAAPADGTVVVVGPPRPTARPVRWTLEDPPRGGPAAGLAAGLAALGPDASSHVLVLAADLPRASALAAALLAERPAADARVVVDVDGHPQWTAALLRTEAVRAALGGDADGLSLRAVVGSLDWEPVPVPAGDVADVDTPQDAALLTDAPSPDRSRP